MARWDGYTKLPGTHSSRYYHRNRAAKREYNARTKAAAIAFYSNGSMQCSGCGFADIRALQLDHINDDGAAYRKKVTGGQNTYWDLKKRGYPPGLQVLCANCNTIKEAERRASK